MSGVSVTLAGEADRDAALARVGGLSVIRRQVRMAERAGVASFEVVAGAAPTGLDQELAGTMADVVTDPAPDAVALDPAWIPDAAYLEAVARGERPERRGGLPVADDAERRAAERALFRGLVKDTEGFMSKHVERPISLWISRRLMNTGVTPNQMTWFSVGVGLVGALCFLHAPGTWHVVGALLFLAHSILDGCDGELARLKLLQSRWGGVLDFWGDNVVHSAVFACLGIGWHRTSGGAMPLVLAGLAVLGTLLSATLVYLHTMRGPRDGPLYTSVSVGGEPSAMVRVADALSRRDFIYLVVILAIVGRTHWFLVLSAVGAPVYALLLLWIRRRDRRVSSRP